MVHPDRGCQGLGYREEGDESIEQLGVLVAKLSGKYTETPYASLNTCPAFLLTPPTRVVHVLPCVCSMGFGKIIMKYPPL